MTKKIGTIVNSAMHASIEKSGDLWHVKVNYDCIYDIIAENQQKYSFLEDLGWKAIDSVYIKTMEAELRCKYPRAMIADCHGNDDYAIDKSHFVPEYQPEFRRGDLVSFIPNWFERLFGYVHLRKIKLLKPRSNKTDEVICDVIDNLTSKVRIDDVPSEEEVDLMFRTHHW